MHALPEHVICAFLAHIRHVRADCMCIHYCLVYSYCVFLRFLENKKEDLLASVVEKQIKTTSNIRQNSSHKLDEDIKKSLLAQYAHESDEDF